MGVGGAVDTPVTLFSNSVLRVLYNSCLSETASGDVPVVSTMFPLYQPAWITPL